MWDAARGLLRWVDIIPGQVHAFDPATSAHTWFDVGDPVGTVGLTRSGGLVLALADRFVLADHDGQHAGRLGAFTVDRSVVRFNDGKPDPWGNFCAGTCAWAPNGPPCALYRLRPDGAVGEIVGDVGVSNGLDWSDDRMAFFFADSATGGVDLFDTDPDYGTLSHRRRFVTVGGVPDGLTLDAEGGLWVAIWGRGELRRYTPGGQLDTVVASECPTVCGPRSRSAPPRSWPACSCGSARSWSSRAIRSAWPSGPWPGYRRYGPWSWS